MKEGPIIPAGVPDEIRKALKHSGDHGGGDEGNRGQNKGEASFPKHTPFNPDKGYTGHGKGVGDKLPRRK